jgi:hypothetical protein
MSYQHWIPDICRDFGLHVKLYPRWETRGSVNFGPRGVMPHHTGVNNPIPKMLAEGRPGLSGPLCNVEFGQDALVTVIAAGRANHAGAGKCAGLSGNSYWLGIEADSDGKHVSGAQREMYPVLCAALIHGLRREGPICAHKEYAGYRGKWDPGNWDMNDMRHRTGIALARHKHGPPAPPAPPAPPVAPPEPPKPIINYKEDMGMIVRAYGGWYWLLGGELSHAAQGAEMPKSMKQASEKGVPVVEFTDYEFKQRLLAGTEERADLAKRINEREG